MISVLPGIGAAAAILYLGAFCRAGASPVKSFVKTLSVGALALAGWVAGVPWLLTLGLTLGTLGDFCLSREGARPFFAGLVAFAAAHLAYIGLFATSAGWSAADLLDPARGLSALALCAVAAMLAARLLPRTGDLRVPVAVYVAIILVMGLAALGLPTVFAPAILGAALFILSDAVLSAELFLMRPDHPARRWTPFVVWSCYWSAQALFLASWI